MLCHAMPCYENENASYTDTIVSEKQQQMRKGKNETEKTQQKRTNNR